MPPSGPLTVFGAMHHPGASPVWALWEAIYMEPMRGGLEQNENFLMQGVSAAHRSFGGGALPCLGRSPVSYPASGWMTSTPNPCTKRPAGGLEEGIVWVLVHSPLSGLTV